MSPWCCCHHGALSSGVHACTKVTRLPMQQFVPTSLHPPVKQTRLFTARRKCSRSAELAEEDWLVSKRMRRKQWPGSHTDWPRQWLAGQRGGGRHQNPDSHGSQALSNKQPPALVQGPSCASNSTPPRSPQPRHHHPGYQVVCLLTQHDLWDPRFPCPRPT